ncbi:hypothetical protein CA234_15760 [Sphingomonas sp. ABOLE]|nr:hypothetical protein CA234_15760 [Sphingomonas sp. ABOLE]
MGIVRAFGARGKGVRPISLSPGAIDEGPGCTPIPRHPREGGDPLALKLRLLPPASWQMDSRLRGNDNGLAKLLSIVARAVLSHKGRGKGVTAWRSSRPARSRRRRCLRSSRSR